MTVYTSIYAMRRAIERQQQQQKQQEKPLGSDRLTPGRTCKDILESSMKSGMQAKDGPYWIDPNLGSPGDAFSVFCNMTAGGQTCLQPTRSTASVSFSKFI